MILRSILHTLLIPSTYILLLLHRLCLPTVVLSFFLFNNPATTEIYTLSLHDALPIHLDDHAVARSARTAGCGVEQPIDRGRSEEHTSELQSLRHLVCRLLLEKKKKNTTSIRNR